MHAIWKILFVLFIALPKAEATISYSEKKSKIQTPTDAIEYLFPKIRDFTRIVIGDVVLKIEPPDIKLNWKIRRSNLKGKWRISFINVKSVSREMSYTVEFPIGAAETFDIKSWFFEIPSNCYVGISPTERNDAWLLSILTRL